MLTHQARQDPEVEIEGPLDATWIEAGTWQVDIAGTLYPAIASLKSLFDPENKKIKG